MKNIVKAIASLTVAAVLSVATGCAAIPGGPVTDGQNMGWNAPNQNG